MFSSDCNEYTNLPPAFALLSIILAYLLSTLLKSLSFDYWFIDVPSVWGFYWIIKKVYSKWLWKVQILSGKIKFSKIPNLNGDWRGVLNSHNSGNQMQIEFKAKVFQDWDKLSIILETSFSKSESSYCHMSFVSPEGAYLTYLYVNKPKIGAPADFQIHNGLCELLISKNEKSMEGEYFTGRGRSTIGNIEFYKKENN